MKALLVAAIFALFPSPALAAAMTSADTAIVVAFTEAETEPGSEAPTTTAVSQGGITPAELAPPADDAEVEDQWTAKYLAPTVAVLGILGVIAAFALYGLRVRARYRISDSASD